MPSVRIAVTGVGMVSALGADAPRSFARLLQGDIGFGQVSLFDVSQQRCRIAAEISDLRVGDVAPASEAQSWSRTDALGVLAAREALRSAGVDPEVPVSLACGGTTGGMYEAEGVLASLDGGQLSSDAAAQRLLSYPLATTAARIAQVARVERSVTVCSACSSGANALVQGAAWLVTGKARRVLAGGADGLCLLTYTGFNALGATDPGPCRPFDAERAGLTLGEGAAFLVLEREEEAVRRGAPVLAWFSGWAIGAEAHHITHPEPSGETARHLITEAFERAALSADEIDYVNAHGTATRHNDSMEARALHAAFGAHLEHLLVSSSKGQLGHTLGAAGAIEAVVTVLALDSGMVPPTGGTTQPDPALELVPVMGKARPAQLRAALSSSFGFGGTGCVLAFQHADSKPRLHGGGRPWYNLITGATALAGGKVLTGPDLESLLDDGSAKEWLSAEREPLDLRDTLDPSRSRRFDRGTAMVTHGVEQALEQTGLDGSAVGLAAGTAYGNVERSVEFLRRVAERGPRRASPADFPHLVPSAPAGNASIYSELRGPVVSVSDLHATPQASLEVASSFLDLGLCRAVIAGSAEPHDAIVSRVLEPLYHREERGYRGEGAGWVVVESSLSLALRAGAALGILEQVEIGSSQAEVLARLRPPSFPPAVILTSHEDAHAIHEALAESPWSEALELELHPSVGSHEAVGAVALAVGAQMVSTGGAGEALVLTLVGEGLGYALLRSVRGQS